MARGCGGKPGPGVPAFALGAAAGGADLPAALVHQQRLDRFCAGQLRPCRQCEREVRRHPQDVRLAAGLEELAQLRAVPVDLVAAGEVEPDAVGVRAGAQVDGKLALGAELQVQRQAHEQGLHRVLDVLAGDPLAGADQRVPGLVPHVGQVHGVDPVGHPPRAPQVLTLDSRGRLAGLFLPGLVDRPDHQAAAPSPAPGRLLQPRCREPAHHAHRGERVPARVIEQPLGFVRRPVPGMPGDAPPVELRQLAHHRGEVPARLQPRLDAPETRPQQLQQLRAFPQHQPGAYPDGSSRL